MNRRLFNIATALSALLLLLALAAWTRTWFADEQVRYASWHPSSRTFTRTNVELDGGRISLYRTKVLADSGQDLSEMAALAKPALTREHAPPWTGDRGPDWQAYTIKGQRTESPTGLTTQWTARMPLWPIALGAAVLPAVWSYRRSSGRRRRRARAMAGQCLACGYDLRASTGRCPECGSEVQRQPAEGAKIATIHPLQPGRTYLLASLARSVDGTTVLAVPELSIVEVPVGLDVSLLNDKTLVEQINLIFQARKAEIDRQQQELKREAELLDQALRVNAG